MTCAFIAADSRHLTEGRYGENRGLTGGPRNIARPLGTWKLFWKFCIVQLRRRALVPYCLSDDAVRRYQPFGVLRAVLLRPGGGIPENEIVIKEKSKIHLPVLGLVPLGSCSGSRGASRKWAHWRN